MSLLPERQMDSLKAAWLHADDVEHKQAIDHEISERIGRALLLREPTQADYAQAILVLRGAAAQARAWHGYATEQGIDPQGAADAAKEAEGFMAVALLLEAKGGSHG